MRRIVAILAALTTMVAVSVGLAAPAAAHHDAWCSVHTFAGSTTGVLDNDVNREDWWTHDSTAASRTFTLQQTGGTANLWVSDPGCTTTLCNDYTSGATTKQCTISGSGRVEIEIFWFSDDGADIVNYTLTVTETFAQCSDGFDNDGDGRTDYPSDPGCTSTSDTTESPNPQCSDGFDNDGDGRTDYPADPGCTGQTDTSESPDPAQCSDGIDNDGDGRTDYPADFGCTSSSDTTEAPNPQCSDGADNDGDGRTDYPSDLGCTSSFDTTESPNPQCSDGADNDGDGRTDYPSDPGCTSQADNSESPDPAQCSDGLDNDGDGRTDYPSDPGCSGPGDNQEGPGCAPTQGILVCLTPGSEIQRVTVYGPEFPPGPSVRVAGWVEVYRFTLPTGATASLPCVRLVAAGSGVNPCATAGGTYVSTTATLVDQTASVPDPELSDLVASVGVCNAELTVLAGDVGINSAPAFAIC